MELTKEEKQVARAGYSGCETGPDMHRVYAAVSAVLEMRDSGHEALRDDVSKDEQIAVLSSAFHDVLCDFHTEDATFQETKERYLAEALAENKMIESLLPMFMEIAGMPALTPAAPETPTEPVSMTFYGNSLCATCWGPLAKGCHWIPGEGETPSKIAVCEKCFRASQSKIRTSFIHPPIPVRAFDWVAWIDGEEESMRYGYGRTEQEAKDELSNVLGELNEAAQPPADGQLVELPTTSLERRTLREVERGLMSLDGLMCETQIPEALEDAHLSILNPLVEKIRLVLSEPPVFSEKELREAGIGPPLGEECDSLLKQMDRKYCQIRGVPAKDADSHLRALTAAMQVCLSSRDKEWSGWGIVEVAVCNPSVAEYVKNWEERTTKAENAVSEEIDERDKLEERLTALADAVGEYFGVPVGEWSSSNDPDKEALKILNDEYKTKIVEELSEKGRAE